ncbi:hypothetical protein AB3U99_05420 [Niallia sp. JL1B1071]|uniref:hypothetical protein n=1 Tax=Niallia tiangongensis TaxID=3237105 RepID=UPI0037DC0680
MKKVYKLLTSLAVILCIVFAYVQYKFISTENAVEKYLIITEKHTKDTIKKDSFIANLPGNKNWMVSVKIKGDSKTYFYFLNRNDKVVLESYVENGVEHVLNQIMN